MATKILFSSLLSLALAQTTTLTIPVIGHDAGTLGASVVSANPTATTFSIACYKSADCGVFPKELLVYGPSTYNIDMSDPNTDFTATIDCAFGSNGAVCKETAGGSEANFPGSSTETYPASEVGGVAIVVTAGVEKLTAGAKATGSVSAGKSSATAGASVATVASQTASAGSGMPGASKTGAAPASASTGAATANVVVLGGGLVGAAAGLLGGMLL